ncbi:sodium:solute symporter family protein [Aliifodinibius sp. S!AR15-10]|uniref:sodium:solute symporter family protein n=1 Tax=Aliifodinibius sp. S!AR15-10 TaxID=2950437 RepID=UPI002857B9E0|nr:sodium:solute symporter family protein [Aliifodinibius sp. S!AR15-10]MDR8391155.1 sodium:solute symporter family protein [Aliifodinibius sp. S!AR15-10]
MEDWIIILICCGLYLLISLAMGIIPGLQVSSSVSGFVAGDRRMNLLVLYFVMGASIFSSFAFLGGPGWAYSRGAAAFYIIAYGTTGIIPFYFFGPKARRLGEKYGFVTQAELLEDRFNSKMISVLLAVLSVIAFIPYLTLQMKGAGYVLSTISEGHIPQWLGAALAYGVVLIYVFYSGLMGVGWTNTFQGLFMMVIAWFLGIYLPNELYGGVGEMFTQIAQSDLSAMLTAPGLDAAGKPWNWWAFSSAVLVSAIGFSMWPHLFMRAFAANSDKTVKLTVVLYPSFQLFIVPILLIGFSAILAFPGIDQADTVVPFLLTQIDLPVIVVGLVVAGTLAASMSSGDAILHSAASIAVRDGITKFFRGEMNDEKQRRFIRILVVLIGLTAYYFAVISEVSIVALLLGAYGGVAQIFPPVFSMFYWRRATGKGALAGLTSGILVTIFFLLYPDLRPVPLHEGLWGLAVNVILLVVVSLNTEPELKKRIERYINA